MAGRQFQTRIGLLASHPCLRRLPRAVVVEGRIQPVVTEGFKPDAHTGGHDWIVVMQVHIVASTSDRMCGDPRRETREGTHML